MKKPERTPEEIKKGLWCCHGQYSGSCGRCPYSNDGRDCGRNGVQIMKDALAYIQQLEAKDVQQTQIIAELEASYSQVSKALCGKENATLEEVLQAVEQVKQTKPREKLICQITIPTADALLKAFEEVELDGKTLAEWLELVKGYKQLEAELEAVKRERDAAAKDLIKVAKSQIICDVCSNDHRKDPICMSHQGDCSECSLHCPCDGCFDEWELRITGANFAWRGVCPENTEVQDNA